MARRAHRQEVVPCERKSKKSRAVSYTRLSKAEKSDSIVHQKAMIREYVREREDIEIVLELEDCNRSGTNFEREGFRNLIKAVERREADCVIVKDLSRFGRNIKEVSEYLESIFPRLGIRFISVLDGYDSDQCGSSDEVLLLQIKSLLHESYARDISRKIHTSVEIMQRSGEWKGSVPYGYRYIGNGEVVVTEAAKVVRLIYRLALAGGKDRRIAAELDRKGYATPLEYRQEKSLYSCGMRHWSACSVGRILENGGVIIDIICMCIFIFWRGLYGKSE